MKKKSSVLALCALVASPMHANIGTAATHALNAHNPSYQPTDTKKEFLTRLEDRWKHAKELRAADHPDPYKAVEKTLDAGWKHTWCQKNPGSCFAFYAGITVAGVVGVIALIAYLSHP